MSKIPAKIVSSFTQIQTELWSKVSLVFSEAAGDGFAFSTPVTSSVKASELKAEIGTPMLTIQCSFNGLPENPQVIALSPDTVLSLVEHLSGERPVEVDDAAVTAIRPLMDAIVQGLCTGVGQMRSETLVASDLTVRFQVFVIPPNLQKGDEIAKVTVNFAAGDFSGSLLWLTDSETVHFILNEMIEEPETVTIPFPQVGAPSQSHLPQLPVQDNSSIDRLLDIPLEVSVELGRVRMLVRDIIDLGTGSIVEIDKAAGEPVDVLVNGRLVARGEVVVIEDNFGVRITEILNPHERLSKLGEVA